MAENFNEIVQLVSKEAKQKGISNKALLSDIFATYVKLIRL